MKLMYFSRVRELIGISEEIVDLPETVGTVSELLAWLKSRGPEYNQALSDSGKIRVAVDQIHTEHGEPLVNAQEVAIFPPMTGG